MCHVPVVSHAVLFPTSPDPLSYTVAVWGGTLVLAVIYFYLPKYGGKNWFTGPISTVQEVEDEKTPGE